MRKCFVNCLAYYSANYDVPIVPFKNFNVPLFALTDGALIYCFEKFVSISLEAYSWEMRAK